MVFKARALGTLLAGAVLVFQAGLRAGQRVDLEEGFKLLQASLSLGQEDYFNIWPDFDLRTIPVSLYTDETAWLINHPAPGPPFARSDRWLLQWRMYSSPRKPGDFYGNTSLRHNGHLTSILKVSEKMTPARFTELVFHEVFHTFQMTNPRLKNRNGNVLIQPFFPVEDVDYYIMAFVEQAMLKEACLAREDEDSVRFLRLYYTVLGERIKRTEPEFAEFEFEEQINEGLATYSGHLGLEMMGYEKEAREQFLKLLNSKTVTPTGFRRRCYGTGRALAELLDRFEPGWKRDFSMEDTLVERIQRRIPPHTVEDVRSVLELLMTPKLREEFQWHLKAEAEKREELRRQVMQPGYVTVRFLGEKILEHPRVRFDPLNVHRVASDLLVHTRLLYLGKGARFDLRAQDYPIINRIVPGNLLSIREVIFALPEGASISLDNQEAAKFPDFMTVRDMSIRSPSFQLRLKNAELRPSANGPLILLR